LETDWLDVLWNILTWLGNVAESFVTLAVQIRKRLWPFSLNFLENIWRNGLQEWQNFLPHCQAMWGCFKARQASRFPNERFRVRD
jgi:hypothetical protein